MVHGVVLTSPSSTVYSNALLATLNSRSRVRDALNQSVSLCQPSSAGVRRVVSQSSRNEAVTSHRTTSPLVSPPLSPSSMVIDVDASRSWTPGSWAREVHSRLDAERGLDSKRKHDRYAIGENERDVGAEDASSLTPIDTKPRIFGPGGT
jgi:hypothetical protein